MTTAVAADWYVAQTHPNAESKAVAHLERQGFETYLPRYMKTARHARRVNLLKAPLFPRYVFVRVDMEKQRWRVINSTIGVTCLVGHGGNPLPVQSDIVDGLKRREGPNGYFNLEAPALRFKAGDAVRLVHGVLDACQGIFEARTDKDRVAILLDLLGRKVRVVIDAASVTAA